LVLAAKIFKVNEEASLDVIFQKLRGFREEEPCEISGESKQLATEIVGLKLEKDVLSGVLAKDFVLTKYYRGGEVQTLTTEEVPFYFKLFDGKIFLIVVAPTKPRGVKKLLANYVANKLSEIVFGRGGGIVETKIPHDTLRELHESNPRATKLIWFDDVDFPDVGKLALSGSALADTELYHEYLEHGRVWYVVFEVGKREMVVGIARNCVITLFSKASVDEFKEFILEDMIPLVE